MDVADRPWLLRGAVLGLALAVGIVAWLATRDDGEVPAPAQQPVAEEARIVAAAELREIASSAGYPVYWAGPLPGTDLELTEMGESGVQLRYVSAGTEAGADPAAFLTVATYPLADPAGALDAFAREPGSIVRRAPGGREVVTSAAKRTSAYFVAPGNSVQVEVYDPSPQRALSLALSKRVQPIG